MCAVHWQETFVLVEQGHINASMVWTVKMNEPIIERPHFFGCKQTTK